MKDILIYNLEFFPMLTVRPSVRICHLYASSWTHQSTSPNLYNYLQKRQNKRKKTEQCYWFILIWYWKLCLTTKWFSQLHGHRAIQSLFVMCHVRMWEGMCEQTKRGRERDLTSRSLARLCRDHTSPPINRPFFSQGVGRQNSSDISSTCYGRHLFDLCPFPPIRPKSVWSCACLLYLFLLCV